MAVTIKLPALAVALRIQGTEAPVAAEYAGILQQLLDAATELVNEYSPEAGDATANQAVTQMAAYLYDRPAYSKTPSNPFVDSGAKALLSGRHVGATASIK